MRVGVIGVGVAGMSHVFDLVSSDRFTLAAVCSRRAERAATVAGMFGIGGIYNDPATMIADTRLDAVVVATPPHASPAVAATCLAAGLPTLIDKPAAPTEAALNVLRARLAQAEALAVVGYNRRYQSHVRHARRLLGAGRIGRLTSVECRWAGPYTSRYTSAETYRARAGWGEGVVLDTACHIVDTLVYLGLAPLEIRWARLAAGPTGADVSAQVEASALPHGLPVSVRIRDRNGNEAWCITLRGTRGRLCLSRTSLTGTTVAGPIVEPAAELRRPIDDLIDLAAGESTCGPRLTEASAVLAIIDQIRHAATRQRSWSRPRAKALGRLNGAC